MLAAEYILIFRVVGKHCVGSKDRDMDGGVRDECDYSLGDFHQQTGIKGLSMYPCGRFIKAVMALLCLMVVIPFAAYAVERPKGSALPPPLVEEPGGSDLPAAIQELCRAMQFHDFESWYRLLSNESREGRTEEEFVVQHQRLLEGTISSLQGRFKVPFMVRTEVVVWRYPKFYIGRLTVIYFSKHSIERGRVVYETAVDIAFEIEPDGRITTKFGGYGNTGSTSELRILPPGGV